MCNNNKKTERSRGAIIVGHPGHELRVLSWVRRNKPLAVTLTDGSSHDSKPRLELSRQILLDAGAVPSRIFGLASDRDFYLFILAGCHDYFLNIAESLAKMLVTYEIEYVVGDAIEGYNPTHDLCRLLIDRAVHVASEQSGVIIKNYAFPLIGHPSPPDMPRENLCLKLSAEEFASKITEAERYAAIVGGHFASEVELSSERFGKEAFACECFWPTQTQAEMARFEKQRPFYEQYGEKQVAAGIYSEVIRYGEHIAPLVKVLLS